MELWRPIGRFHISQQEGNPQILAKISLQPPTQMKSCNRLMYVTNLPGTQYAPTVVPTTTTIIKPASRSRVQIRQGPTTTTWTETVPTADQYSVEYMREFMPNYVPPTQTVTEVITTVHPSITTGHSRSGVRYSNSRSGVRIGPAPMITTVTVPLRRSRVEVLPTTTVQTVYGPPPPRPFIPLPTKHVEQVTTVQTVENVNPLGINPADIVDMAVGIGKQIGKLIGI